MSMPQTSAMNLQPTLGPAVLLPPVLLPSKLLRLNFQKEKSEILSFSIQVLCSSKLKAPQGCLQYFTGTTGTITTYNYQSGAGVLLVNQDYSICVRSERTYCAVCYWSTAFKMSVPGAADGNKGVDTRCGSPGINPAFTKGGG